MSPANTQQTIKNSIRASGVALHTGGKVNMTLHPAEIDAGVVFKRIDLPGCIVFKACAGSVGDTQMATSLSAQGYQLSTIEHMMSALSG